MDKLIKYTSWWSKKLRNLSASWWNMGVGGGVGTARKLESVAQAGQILKYRGGYSWQIIESVPEMASIPCCKR